MGRKQHIWTLENWKNKQDIMGKNTLSGLHTRIDRNVDPEVKYALKIFISWVRSEYSFPIRIPIYVKDTRRIKAKDGEMVCGTFWMPYDSMKGAYIRIATGDYHEMCKKIGKYDAILNILLCIAHELTHYYQWLNDLQLTDIGRERQATTYSYYVVYEFLNEYENLFLERYEKAGDS